VSPLLPLFLGIVRSFADRLGVFRPGQAVTFTMYEFLKEKLEKSTIPYTGGKYEE
jgi:solute carrier family 25 (mitochondrial citrate transporter), member 1